MINRISFIFLLFGLVFSSCNSEKNSKMVLSNDTSMFNDDILKYYQAQLDSASYYLHLMDTSLSLDGNKKWFLNSRKWYKRVEPLLIAYDFENYKTINGPNLLKVEIEDYTDIKKRKPRSYQVLEEILFADDLDNKELHLTLLFMKTRVPFIAKNHMIYNQWDRHHLKMVRDAIVNVATKGITGFDSPMLANSLQEAIWNYESLQKVMTLFKDAFDDSDLYEKWNDEVNAAINTLNEGEFDSFDRYGFIKEHTNKELELISLIAKDWGIKWNLSTALNPKATNLFEKDFFNKKMFSPRGAAPMTKERIDLGKVLFNDPNLSLNGNMSCGTCHKSELAFTDGLSKAVGSDGKLLQRNTMTLSYAVYQKSFFHDASSSALEGQIVNVVNNTNEFHIDLKTLEARVRADKSYRIQFDSLYEGNMSDRNIRHAIATYIRSLTPFNSKFDLNMQGKEQTLTEEEILGFNLFMGKAACATCHFPPTFHGTVPPKYSETELEHLGVPATADFENPKMDEDPGQYYPYEVEERRHFFKTATIRNIELTAPYMHNGVYETLEEVLNFYNVGGGVGMGFDLPYQTLPPDSLNLEESEIEAIIAFMKTLTDQPVKY